MVTAFCENLAFFLLLAGAIWLAVPAPAACADIQAATKASAAKSNTGGKSHPFRNLPDIDATERWAVSWQEEVNVFSYGGFANTTVDFGLPHQWNIGFSLINLNLAGNGSQPFNPDGFLNIEKIVGLREDWRVLIGSQLGVPLFHVTPGRRLLAFNYLDSQFDFGDIEAHLGGYYADRAMTGRSEAFGFIAGLRLPLPVTGLFLQADYVSGHNALSAGTAQLLWEVSPAVELGCGAVIPMPGSGTDYAGLLEFNWR